MLLRARSRHRWGTSQRSQRRASGFSGPSDLNPSRNSRKTQLMDAGRPELTEWDYPSAALGFLALRGKGGWPLLIY